MRISPLLISVAFWALLALPAAAGTVEGTVTGADQKPLQGVLVRLTDAASGRSEAVYSNAAGRFTLTTALQGALELRLRTPYFKDLKVAVELAADSRVERQLAMQPMTDPVEISDSLPAAYHFGSLEFERGEGAVFNRFQFQRDCLSCHQLGNPLTRRPRPPELWNVTIERMHRYVGSNFDGALRDRRSQLLAKGFDGKPVTVRPEFPLDPSLSRAKIEEYRLSRGIVPHDAIANPNDGLLYTVDQGASFIAITDPKTGQSEYVSQTGKGNRYRVPDSKTGEIAAFPENTRNAPHSLALGRDGKYYVTNTRTNTIGVFDPKTREWEPSFVIGGGARYPHTVRVDSEGIVWFTLAGSEQVGRIDPQTGQSTVIRLPAVKSGGVSGGTQPYGIDIHPTDGSIWYGRLFGDKIGRIDAKTLALQEFDSPVRGPRRMRFDAKGVLWVTGYSEGELARLDVAGKSFKAKVYRIPEFAGGYRPAPYALGVHPQTNDIWINENMTDRLYRFIPSEERFVAYPVPLAGTYTRDFSFTTDGRACTSNNPLPIAALEGGVAEILCIQVEPDSSAKSALRHVD